MPILICLALSLTYVARGRGDLYGLPKLCWKLLFAAAFGLSTWYYSTPLIGLISAAGAFLSNMVPYGYYRAMGLYTGSTDNWLHIPKQDYPWCFAAMMTIGLLCGTCLFAIYNPVLVLPMVMLEPIIYSVRRSNLIVGDAIRGVALGVLLVVG